MKKFHMNSTPLFIMWVSKHCCFWKKARVCCEHGENVRCQPLAPAHSNYSYPPKQLSKIDLTSITYYGSRLLSAFWDCPCYWTLKREWTHRSFAEFAHGWGGALSSVILYYGNLTDACHHHYNSNRALALRSRRASVSQGHQTVNQLQLSAAFFPIKPG